MKRLFAAACLALLAVPALAASKSDVRIVNQSDWAIHHLFLSSVEDDKWGPDQLGEYTIEPGESFTLRNIPCDLYDIKLIDEEGDECVVTGVEVCKNDQSWVITSEDLAACQGY
jgi:hypothetical protein